MPLDHILTALFDHAGKIIVAVFVLAGLSAWLTLPRAHPVNTLQAWCRTKQLPVPVVKLQPGTFEEERFLAMVPRDQRERLPDGHWAFCRANLRTPNPAEAPR